MNVFCTSGNLGRDAEVKQVGEHTVTTFSIAVRSGYGKNEKTFWLNCNAWNKDKIAQYLTKGSRVGVTGELSVREYDKKDGTKGQSIDLRVTDIDLPPKASTESAPSSTGGGHAKYGNQPVDDVPF
jgi:single-strand DNA-binding protein